MIAKVFAAAFLLLLSGLSMSANAVVNYNSSLSSNTLYMEIPMEQDIDASIVFTLIEDYAMPYWNLSSEDAWNAYANNELTIEEIQPNVQYLLKYDGGELVVIFEGH